jgi:hypothetical protein
MRAATGANQNQQEWNERECGDASVVPVQMTHSFLIGILCDLFNPFSGGL